MGCPNSLCLMTSPLSGQRQSRGPGSTDAVPPVAQTATTPVPVAASTGYRPGSPADSGMTGPNATRGPPIPSPRAAAATRRPSIDFVPGDDDAPASVHDNLRVGRVLASKRRNPRARGERAAVARRGVEQRAFGIGAVNHRRPHQVHSPVPSTAIAGPSSGQPLMAQASSLTRTGARERAAAVGRERERDVADVARVDVPPCGVQRVAGPGGQGGLAAVAHARGQLALGRRRQSGRRRRYRPDFCAIATPSCGAPLLWWSLPAPAARPAASPR